MKDSRYGDLNDTNCKRYHQYVPFKVVGPPGLEPGTKGL
jgi:hypothetical protein